MSAKLDQLLDMASKGVTPQEDCAKSLILTPGSSLTITKAEEVFSRLRVQFRYDGLYANTKRQQDVPIFRWPQNITKDSVAEAACQYLQTTYMPEDVTVIAVQSVRWMGHHWPEAHVKVKDTGRTDYVMVYRVTPEMVDLLIDQQHRCAALDVQVSQQEVVLRQLEDAQEESQYRTRQAQKRRRGDADGDKIAEMVTLGEQLAEARLQLRIAYEDRTAALKALLLHIVGHYEAKPENVWTSVMAKSRAQTALGWLVVNANQLESSHSHPESIAMVGDINNHYFYPPPPSFIKTLHRLPTTLKVQVKRTLNNPMSRAAAAAHVKKTLQNLCNQIEANKAALFEGAQMDSEPGTGGDQDGNK